MADTDRTGPAIIDATVLPPDEVERQREHDLDLYGNAFVFSRLCAGRAMVGGVEVGVDLSVGRDRTGVVIVTGELRDSCAVQRLRELMYKFSNGVSLSVRLPGRGKLYGDHCGQIIVDELPDIVDALALKPRPMDRVPDATQSAPTPAKLTPSEARVARKLAGPWHDPTPWKHTKKGGRR